MSFQNKNRFRPIFKQVLKLRENVQNRQKLLSFKKNKWKSFLRFYINKLKPFKKFKPLDQTKHYVNKYGTRGTSYTKRFRDTLTAGTRFRLFYGNMLRKGLKRRIKIATKSFKLSEFEFIQLFERQLDTVLYRAKFASSMRSARQLISHGNVFVNNEPIKSKTFSLRNGDIVSLHLNCLNLFESHILSSTKWPMPPKHLIVNYKTLQIAYLGDVKSFNPVNDFSFNLKLQKILTYYSR